MEREDCPTEERLVAYVDGLLGDSDEADVDAHIDACRECTALLAGLAQRRTTLGGRYERPGVIEAGTTIDRYVVRGRLGAGAMGVVYEALDPRLRRIVAIKIVRVAGGADPAQARASMLREARALARVSHPNVVPVLAVGSHGDDVYLVMECVEGETLRAWLDHAPRDWLEIVRAYATAGRGLAAAHAMAVVHRDFKPDNVIIGRDGRVRVIDFGLAHFAPAPESAATEGRDPESARTTTHMVIGTPAYMAPEQLLDPAVDARADQFSLAVSIWEGLCGARPYAASSLAALALDHGAGVPSPPVSSRAPARIHRVLARALAARPRDRYATMDAFVRALEHAAKPPRTRWGAAAASLAAAGVVLLARSPRTCVPPRAPAWDDDARARIRSVASHGAAAGPSTVLEAALDRRVAAWHDAYAQVCAAATAPEGESDARSSCLDVRRLELDAAIELLADPDADDPTPPTEVVARLPAVEPCVTATGPRLSIGDPEALVEQAHAMRSRLARATVLGTAGRHDEAIAIAQDVLARAESIGHDSLHVEAMWRLGALHDLAGRPAEAVPILEAAYFEARRIGHDEVTAGAALELVVALGLRLARVEEAERWLEHAEAAMRRWGAPDAQAELLHLRGTLAQRAGDFEAALADYERSLALFRRSVGEDDFRVARGLEDVARVEQARGEWERALDLGSQVLDIRERLYGDEHALVAYSLNNVGMALLESGLEGAAFDHYAWALEILEESSGPENLFVAGMHNNIGALLGRADEPGAAAMEFAAALPAYESLGPDHPDLAMALRNYGFAALVADDLQAAADALERSYAIAQRRGEADQPAGRATAVGLGRVLAAGGAHRRAIALLEHALAGDVPPLGHRPQEIANAWVELGRSRLQIGDFAGAARALATAREACPASDRGEAVTLGIESLGRALAVSRNAR